MTQHSSRSPSESALVIRRVTAACSGGHCPAVYENDEGDHLVQGAVMPSAAVGLAIPDGEALVELPRGVVMELVRSLQS